MNVGDKVIVDGKGTEIIATAFDEEGTKVYMVKGSVKDYYEEDIIKIAESLGYIVGKYGGEKEAKLLNGLVVDCQNKANTIEKLKKENKEQEKAYTKEIENQCDMVRILVEREYEIRELKEQIDLTERVQKNYKNAFYERTTENAKLRRELGKLETKLKNVLDKYEHVEASEESAIDIYMELKNIYESGNEQ